MHERATWYVLDDGSVADPHDVEADKMGKLKHKKSGVAVAMRGQVPSSRGVNPEEERTKAEKTTKDMKAEEGKRPYRTREIKAE